MSNLIDGATAASEKESAAQTVTRHLSALRAIAERALENPVDPAVPRQERALVVPAEALIALIDLCKLSTELPERVDKLEQKVEKLREGFSDLALRTDPLRFV